MAAASVATASRRRAVTMQPDRAITPLRLLALLLAAAAASSSAAAAGAAARYRGATSDGGDGDSVSPDGNGEASAELASSSARARAWANAAFEFVKALNCDDAVFTSLRECQLLRDLRRRDCAVYTAEAEPGDRLHVVLPDETVGGRATHDGVLVLDPHPDASFGHLVVMFYVDRHTDAATCRRQGRIYAGRNYCMTLALKSRCRNAIDSRNRGVYAVAAAATATANNAENRRPRKYSKRCEINFLPLVYRSPGSAAASSRQSDVATAGIVSAATETDLAVGRSPADSATVAAAESAGALLPPQRQPAPSSWPAARLQQMLSCRGDLPEYFPCPTLRPFNESREPACNPIRDNTRRCETSHDLVRTRCRLFESCDQAVLIGGGWNRQHALQRQWDGLVAAYRMLRSNGFHRDTVKVFYANGMADGIPGFDGEESPEVFPASSKLALRSHIKTMCESPHCVDTLVLYLNSPAKSDGSILLWDVDGDGLADDSERYLVDELVADLASCMARHVLVLADQSFSGEIAKAFRRSPRDHGNVVVYASSKEHEYSYGSEFTLKWAASDHAHTCANDVFQRIKTTMLGSSPESGEAPRTGSSSSRVTIFGAPCDVDPPFTPRELRVYYRGCQNVPTEVWWHRYFQLSYQHRGGGAAPAAAVHALGEPSIPVYRPETLPESDAAAGGGKRK